MPEILKKVAFFALLLASITLPASAEPPPLSAYGNLPEVEEMRISPSGQYFAVLTIVRGRRAIISFDSELKPQQLFAIDDLKVRSFDWIGDDALLVITSQTQSLPVGFTTDQIELWSATIVPMDPAKDLKVVFGSQAEIVDAIFGNYGLRKIDGEWHGYFGGIVLVRNTEHMFVFDHGRPALFNVNLSTGVARKLANPAAENHDSDWLVDAVGKVAATFDMDERSGQWVIRNSDWKVIASGSDPQGHAGLVSLGERGDTVIYSTRNDDGNTEWHEVPLAGGDPQLIFNDVDIDRIYRHPLTGDLMGYLSEEKSVFFDERNQRTAKAVEAAFPDLNVELEDWSPDMRKLIVRTSGQGDSGTWFKVDLNRSSAEAIGFERPVISENQVGPISRVEYKAGDGLQLDGILTLPPGREPKDLPVILFPHGGPRGQDTLDFDWWAQAFASRGYAVFQPNFRGSTNRDEAFIRAGNGEWGGKMQSDISDGLAELVARGIVDRTRACIMGASYGGYAALAGVTIQQGFYRCAVAVAPVTDLSMMYWDEYREAGRDKMSRLNLDEELGPRSNFDAISPRKQAAHADAPILLIHGKDDTVVKFDQSTKMADALKDAGKPYELVVLREEDHWLSRGETRMQMLEAAMAFILKHNPPD